MSDNDILARISVIALIGLACVGFGVWNWLGKRRQRKDAMREFWRR